MPAAGAAVRTPAKGFVHDPPDRARATTALRAAAETAINLAGHSGRAFADGRADLMIGENVAGADDHGGGGSNPGCDMKFT